MEISGRIARQILLFSLGVLVVSMLVFPKKYGTDIPTAPMVNILFELVFYGLVMYLLNRRLTPSQLVSSAGVCLIYRYVLGLILGSAIAAIYGWQLKLAVLAGTGSYLPGMLLHIVAAPFILKPAIASLHTDRVAVRRPSSPSKETADTGITSIAASKEKGFSKTGPSEVQDMSLQSSSPTDSSSTPGGSSEGNGFERATGYIGEDGSVLVAAVVDVEGLLLGNFSRRGFEAEEWAPFALSLVEQNREVVSRLDCGTPEKIDMLFKEKKVIVAAEKAYCLMVVSERSTDDVLNIRINQGLEIIRKYVAERYSEKLIARVEKTYV